jgi:hypothetical protein
MASREDREFEWQQERAREQHLERLRRLGPEYGPGDEPEEPEDPRAAEDAYYDDLAESLRFQVICDGPEMDEPVWVERDL